MNGLEQIMQIARRALEAFSLTEISSRPLAMVRVFGVITIYTELASPWVAHRMDDVLGTLVLSLVMFVAATFVLFGFKTRIAAIVLAATFAVLHLYYGVELGIAKLARPVYEFQFVVLLALTPCGRSLSVDRMLEVRRALAEGREPAPERVRWWQVELFVLLLASTYLWIAIDCSLQEAWLSGAQIEHDLIGLWSSSELLGSSPRVHTAAVVAAWAAMLAAYVLAFGLLIRRWRPYLVWLALVLHFAVMFSFIQTYLDSYHHFMMLVTLLACLDPDRTHAFISVQGDQPAQEEAP